MSQFSLRSKSGELKAKIDAGMMAKMTQSNGIWRQYTSDGEEPTVCFEFTDDLKMDFSVIGIPITLYLWKGDKIIASK